MTQGKGKWVFWGLFEVLALAVLFVAFRPDAVWVDLASATRGPLEVSITEEGKTRVKDRYQVFVPVAGFLHRIRLDVGDRVEQGAILARVDPMPASVLDARSRAEAEARVGAARSALASAQQQIEAARTEADLAAKELARLQALAAGRFVSEEKLQQAQAAADRTRAILRSARFDGEVRAHELRAAQTRLEVSAATSSGASPAETVPVRSPVNGVVLDVVRESEGVIQAGEPVVEVGDPAALEVVVDVLSYDAVRLSPGGQVRLTGWGGPTLNGLVRRVEPAGFEDVSALGVEEQRVRVVADIVSPQEQWQTLGDGYRVDATFVLWAEEDVLQIPASAIFTREDRQYVFLAQEGRARLAEVRTGRSNGLYTAVTDGLSEGDQVVRHPDRQLQPGSRIRVR